MATLGQAFVEVHADTKPFAKEVRREITAILKSVDATIKVHAEKVGVTIGEGVGNGIAGETDRINRTFRNRIVTGFRDAGNQASRAFRESFQRLATSNFILFRVVGNLAQRFGTLFSTVARIGREVFDFTNSVVLLGRALVSVGVEGFKSLIGIGNSLREQMDNLSKATTAVGSAILSLASTAASGGIALAAAAAAAILLTGVLAALAAVAIVALAPFADLLNFVLLLPAAMSILLATVLPLVLAFHDLGDALKLVFERDPKKLAEGLAKLSGPMRDLVATLRSVAPLLSSLQETTQREFLGPILKVLAPVIRGLAPLLRRGFGDVARAMGTFVAQALTLLNSPAFQQFLVGLFPAVATMIQTLAPSLLRVLSALGLATTASLPTVQKLVEGLGRLLDRFATWIETTVADGRFQGFLDDATNSLNTIWGLVTTLIGLFGDMFTKVNDDGRTFLETITAGLNKFRDWITSPQGQRALENAVIVAQLFALAFIGALEVVRQIVDGLSHAVTLMKWLIDHLGVVGPLLSGPPPGPTWHEPATGLSSTTVGDLPRYSGGGVVGYDQIALVHQGEPILDPANSASRNRAILGQAGMLDEVYDQQGTINVYIGNEKLAEYTDVRISRYNKDIGRRMSFTPRSA